MEANFAEVEFLENLPQPTLDLELQLRRNLAGFD
jgi:hypothetical protein